MPITKELLSTLRSQIEKDLDITRAAFYRAEGILRILDVLQEQLKDSLPDDPTKNGDINHGD